ncbi:2-dehydropantoate 2-reductase [Clostridium sediminicola]|uniref:ketopantoate reductase family protein n=1 Tax=Clostridium sediminicola TaxID=3114879 RepID=UPI0031F22DF6
MKINSIYVVGAGAIGASYAAKLYDMNPESVTIIANEKRCEKYKKGIKVNGKEYFFQTVIPEKVKEKADFIIVAVKNHHLSEAMRNIEKAVGKNTIIMSLLNGISSEDILGEKFGIERLVYSMCVGIDAVRIENETKYSNIGKIFFGEKTNIDLSNKVQDIKDIFERAEIPYIIPENMIKKLWWKFMINTGINQISAVLRVPYGVLKKDENATQLLERTMKEVIEISKYEGINLNNEDYEEWLRILNNLSDEGKTSMLQDVEAGRKTEVELFAGTIVKLAEKHNIRTPMNEILLKMISVLEGEI